MSTDRENEMFLHYIDTGNVRDLAEWNKYMDSTLSLKMRDHGFGDITSGVANFFAHTATRADWHRWGFEGEERDDMLIKMMRHAIMKNRTDLFDIYLSASIDFNRGFANFHLITDTLEAPVDDGQKGALVQALLAKGIYKVQSPERFVETALKTGSLRALGPLLAATHVDIHANREAALRQAAVNGQKDLARYLVEKQDANIDLAISVAKQDGFNGNASLLLTVKDELQTVRDLQRQVAELKATVKELTEAVNELRGPEQKLDKPVLTRPHIP